MNEVIAAAVLGMFGFTGVSPTILFQDDFEGGELSAWTGKSGGATSAKIVADPLEAGNKVMSFDARTQNGDAFTVSSLPIGSTTGEVHLQFDYLGLQANAQSPSENLGGFVGIAPDYYLRSATGAWVAGTEPSAVNGLGGLEGIPIVDDGTWHHYDIDLSMYGDAFMSANGSLNAHLTFEDWSFSPYGTDSPAGDVYFDNVSLVIVPEPTTLGLGMMGMAVFLTARQWRKQRCTTRCETGPMPDC